MVGMTILSRINVDYVSLASHGNRHNHIRNKRELFSRRNSSLKAAISQPFDVSPVLPLQFKSQAKMSTIRPVFPNYLFISYDYD